MSMNAKTKHERLILKWDDQDDLSDTNDLIHQHFTDLEPTFEDWGDVADEGLRLWNLMFEENVEPDSPAEGVLAGIAAAAYNLAIFQIAKQIGVSCGSLMIALEQDPAGDAQTLQARCKDSEEFLARCKAIELRRSERLL